jgi:DNA primase
VEGNFDVVQMHQRGFTETVAPLGTSFTDAQAKLLRRHTDRVTFLFDGDTDNLSLVQTTLNIPRVRDLLDQRVSALHRCAMNDVHQIFGDLPDDPAHLS